MVKGDCKDCKKKKKCKVYQFYKDKKVKITNCKEYEKAISKV